MITSTCYMQKYLPLLFIIYFAQVLTPSLEHLKLSYMFVNNNIHLKYLLHVSLNISNTLVDMYMKLHKHLGFNGPKCTHVFKCL